MRIAYLDCFAGIAGDMFLAALVHAGVPEDVLQKATEALHINAALRIETVDRSGISSTKVHVLENGRLAEEGQRLSHSHIDPIAHAHAHFHDRGHKHTHGHEHTHEHEHRQEHEHTHEHEHEYTHAEKHNHPHTHGRSLTEIRSLIQGADLAQPVKELALRAFNLLGHAEAKIHNVPVDKIHFHEVGAVDAIVDIVASAAGIHYLNVETWYSSPVNVGGGMIQCAHGTFPVPAPATADLLRDAPTYSAHSQKELVTPTGAALLRALAPTFGPQPPMRVENIGYGAGTRNPKDFPNVLRLSLGEASQAPAQSASGEERNARQDVVANAERQTVAVLETALDDATPQLLAFVAEQALAHGALDVMLTPVLMKKGRAGTLLSVLASPEHSETLQELILRETPTLGLRIRHDQRVALARQHQAVQTPYGRIRVKLGLQNGEPTNATPEYEDCKSAALQYNTPLKQVQQAAISAYLQAVSPATDN